MSTHFESSGTPPIYHILEKCTATFSSYLLLKRNPVFGASAQRISRPSYTAVVALTATCKNLSPISRFPSPKIRFSSGNPIFITRNPIFPNWLSAFFNDFPLSSMAFRFLQRLSAFFNGFSLSSTAFQFSSMAFRFSSTAFLFSRNPRKSIYGG